MKTIKYTGDEIRQLLPNAVDSLAVFDLFESKVQSEGQVICQFRLNGMTFSEKGGNEVLRMPLQDIEGVEMLVDTPQNLYVSVILNWIEDLPKLIRRADDLATALRHKGIETQYTPFVRAIDDCQFLIDSLISIRAFPRASGIALSDEWSQAEKSTLDAVGESLKAFEKKDSNWLADVIEYDLAHSLQKWLELMVQLCEQTMGSSEKIGNGDDGSVSEAPDSFVHEQTRGSREAL